MAKDPVCGMKVQEKNAADTAGHWGVTYYFCRPDCKTLFDKHPLKYIPRK